MRAGIAVNSCNVIKHSFTNNELYSCNLLVTVDEAVYLMFIRACPQSTQSVSKGFM